MNTKHRHNLSRKPCQICVECQDFCANKEDLCSVCYCIKYNTFTQDNVHHSPDYENRIKNWLREIKSLLLSQRKCVSKSEMMGILREIGKIKEIKVSELYEILEACQAYLSIGQARQIISFLEIKNMKTPKNCFIVLTRVWDYWMIKKTDFDHSYLLNKYGKPPNSLNEILRQYIMIKSKLEMFLKLEKAFYESIDFIQLHCCQ